jgi:hypothetical protein
MDKRRQCQDVMRANRGIMRGGMRSNPVLGVDLLGKSGKVAVRCSICGASILRSKYSRSKSHYCSKECISVAFTNPLTNGYYKNYRRVKCPKIYCEMAWKDGKVAEHRLIVARQLGRPLAQHEEVHHIDGNRKNNAPENLQLIDINEHRGLHKAEREKREFDAIANAIFIPIARVCYGV